MLCTFTTNGGRILVIRTDDIRRIEDRGDAAMLAYVIGDDVFQFEITGTAAENRDRIQQEELDMIARVETHRYKTQMLLQAQPTPRGRQAQ